jgi:hypothetical protein
MEPLKYEDILFLYKEPTAKILNPPNVVNGNTTLSVLTPFLYVVIFVPSYDADKYINSL